MIVNLPPTTYIAQTYSCDAYGASSYSDCPVSSDGTGAAVTTDPATNPPANNTTTNPPVPGNTNQQENSPIAAVAAMDWTIIIPLALAVAVLVAWIGLLVSQRHRASRA